MVCYDYQSARIRTDYRRDQINGLITSAQFGWLERSLWIHDKKCFLYLYKNYVCLKPCSDMKVHVTLLGHHLVACRSFKFLHRKWYQFGLSWPYTILTDYTLTRNLLLRFIYIEIALIIACLPLLVHPIWPTSVFVIAHIKGIVLFFTVNHLLYLGPRIQLVLTRNFEWCRRLIATFLFLYA